jgi:hypothetical protein
MAAALWNRPAIDFATPNSYPSWHYLHKGYFGPVQYYAPPAVVQTTTTTTATPPAKHVPANPSRPPGGSH